MNTNTLNTLNDLLSNWHFKEERPIIDALILFSADNKLIFNYFNLNSYDITNCYYFGVYLGDDKIEILGIINILTKEQIYLTQSNLSWNWDETVVDRWMNLENINKLEN